jgi:hypothetical protein
MTLDQILNMEKHAGRAINAIQSVGVNAEAYDSLQRVEDLLAEVRHFAVCWDDQRRLSDNNQIDPIQARNTRDEIINRLVTFIVPSRF